MTAVAIHDQLDLGVLITEKHQEAAVNTSASVREDRRV
jgi:hypothetical protein